MSIAIQFNETVEVQRLGLVPGTNRKEFVTLNPTLSCHIQPLEPQFTADISGGFGKDFLMFCETADVQEGDRIVRDSDESGEEPRTYKVTAVESFDFQGNSHMEVQIRIFESN